MLTLKQLREYLDNNTQQTCRLCDEWLNDSDVFNAIHCQQDICEDCFYKELGEVSEMRCGT